MESKLHFIGIGGIGMSAIAKIMLHQGFSVSGSDVVPCRLIDELIAAGAVVNFGHSPENIPADCEAVVYSSAVKEDNEEMVGARRRGLKIYRRAEMLAYLMSTRRGIGVAGAHGKTTTSAMIATMLERCGCDPTVVIGGMLPAIGGSNARAGDGPDLVAEADESDGTFLLLHPQIAVVTNIEPDHLDHYGNFDKIKDAFEQYFRQIPQDGFSVVCNDCPVCREMAQRHISCQLGMTFAEDALLMLNILLDCQRVYGDAGRSGYHYRMHGQSSMHNYGFALAALRIDYAHRLRQLFDSRGMAGIPTLEGNYRQYLLYCALATVRQVGGKFSELKKSQPEVYRWFADTVRSIPVFRGSHLPLRDRAVLILLRLRLYRLLCLLYDINHFIRYKPKGV